MINDTADGWKGVCCVHTLSHSVSTQEARTSPPFLYTICIALPSSLVVSIMTNSSCRLCCAVLPNSFTPTVLITTVFTALHISQSHDSLCLGWPLCCPHSEPSLALPLLPHPGRLRLSSCSIRQLVQMSTLVYMTRKHAGTALCFAPGEVGQKRT